MTYLEILGALTLIGVGIAMLRHSLKRILFRVFCHKLGLAPTQELYEEYNRGLLATNKLKVYTRSTAVTNIIKVPRNWIKEIL